MLEQERFNENHAIFSFDVVSLYTNIPHDDGVAAIINRGEIFNNTKNYTTTAKLAELVLKNNIFKFNDEWYIQQQGTAMGTKMAPAYANIFLATIVQI